MKGVVQLANSCGCKAGTLAAEKASAGCPATVNETVCVQADVTITPGVSVTGVETYCVGDPVIGACPGTVEESCSFTVSQNICVQIPLTFSADAVAAPSGIVCGTPGVGECTASA